MDERCIYCKYFESTNEGAFGALGEDICSCLICNEDEIDCPDYEEGRPTMDELKPCPCGAMPVKEAKRVMLGSYRDGGYEVTQGRYICPACGNAPDWGQTYCVDYDGGWSKNAEIWNRRADHGTD